MSPEVAILIGWAAGAIIMIMMGIVTFIGLWRIIRDHPEPALAGFKALKSFLKVRTLRLRNIFLSSDEREEWLGDLREKQAKMRYEENRSKLAVMRYTVSTHIRFGWSKLTILALNLFSQISRG
ncbi:hypothetical protein N836_05030 [Leptolyngbya sp. Heron Island J]|uniref:hypothetical protein n=1 Tax=Leptolyngbya sp. Heron Island J TaxID=1385935 RepID=UPI0003B9B9CC|nr:hypothetical protein [Leptolyngbya sp. Heron Island J]ESA36926.1 hypothetical protein N836_05030 [Leptolyngbya sp. Heron Island J]